MSDPKKGPGPPTKFGERMADTTVKLPEYIKARAREIGGGGPRDMSRGIRHAVSVFGAWPITMLNMDSAPKNGSKFMMKIKNDDPDDPEPLFRLCYWAEGGWWFDTGNHLVQPADDHCLGWQTIPRDAG